jgi:hypothetical protein
MKFYYIVESNGRGDKDDLSKQFARTYSTDRIKIYYGGYADKDRSYNLVTVWADKDPAVDTDKFKDVVKMEEAGITSMSRDSKTQYLMDTGFNSADYLRDKAGGLQSVQ